jgi:hypothetical protein
MAYEFRGDFRHPPSVVSGPDVTPPPAHPTPMLGW